MMNRLLPILFFLLLAADNAASGQPHYRCGQHMLQEQLIARYPNAVDYFHHLPERMESLTLAYEEAQQNNLHRTTATVTIPVVFHIVLTQAQINQLGGETGIRTRALSQLAVLNEDFNKENSDTALIPAVFKSLAGNAEIAFGLAHRKPNGQSTEGFEIITTTLPGFDLESGTIGSGFGGSDAKYTAAGGVNAWDPYSYMNIWVINPLQSGGGTILGMAIPPDLVNSFGLPASEKGIVLHYGVFGKRSSSSQFFLPDNDKGRTLTHEMGHMFELAHIWGNQENCSASDGIADTPLQYGANYNCPSFPKLSCNNGPSGDMFMNYMDYVNDGCMHMFTHGQVARMKTMLTLAHESLGLTQHPELLQWPSSVKETGHETAFYIHPNPASEFVSIQFSYTTGLNNIQLINIHGQPVKRIVVTNPQINSYDLDMTDLPKGIYLIRCTFEDGSLTRKIIRQ